MDTEQQQSASNIATMETARSGQEAPVFGQTGPANELEASRFATPTAWNNATVGQQVSRLGTLSGHTLGPNTLQKVMAGDKISATVQYFYQATPGGSSPISNVVLNTLGQLLSGTSSVSSIVKSNATAITSQLGANLGFIDAVQPTGAGGNIPQAYLTILFFDERFNFISAADGGVAQQQVAGSVGAGGSTLGLGNIKAPKNGYAMVYVSNRSEQNVYFDNLQVGKVAGNILEENHYYAYGLRIAAISSRKFGDVSEGEIVNQFLYNGKEMLDEDADLGWIDYGFRNYDPQIGRFPQLDPLADEYPFYTPYQYAGNEPITNIDIDGLEPGQSVLSTTLETAKTLETIVITIPKASNNVNRIWGLVNVIGSTLEVAGGVALGVTTAWTGFGAVAGGVVAVHGLDGLSAGLTQLFTGEETKSYSEKGISKGLQMAGVSKENADIYAVYGDAALSMAMTGGAGKLMKFTKAPVKAIPKAKVVPKVNNVPAKGVTRSLDDLSSIKGATWEEAESLIPKGWTRGPLIKGEGIKFVNPAKKGEQILLEKGWPGAKDPLHSGPYMKISRDGQVTRIPLQGNPTLK